MNRTVVILDNVIASVRNQEVPHSDTVAPVLSILRQEAACTGSVFRSSLPHRAFGDRALGGPVPLQGSVRRVKPWHGTLLCLTQCCTCFLHCVSCGDTSFNPDRVACRGPSQIYCSIGVVNLGVLWACSTESLQGTQGKKVHATGGRGPTAKDTEPEAL